MPYLFTPSDHVGHWRGEKEEQDLGNLGRGEEIPDSFGDLAPFYT